jgi:hypothetical protein
MADGENGKGVKLWFVETCICLFLFMVAGTLALNGSDCWGWFFVGGVFMIPTKSSF